jgi:hypothetical protein
MEAVLMGGIAIGATSLGFCGAVNDVPLLLDAIFQRWTVVGGASGSVAIMTVYTETRDAIDALLDEMTRC